jgi:putative membrane protein
MKLNHLILSTTLFAIALSAGPTFAGNKTLSSADKDILTKLDQASIDEVNLGKLVQKKASNTAVRDFGNRMIYDHNDLMKQAQQLASQFGLTLPSSMDSEGHSIYSKLSDQSGKSFDQQYVKTMLRDHQSNIAGLQKYVDSSQNPQIKDLVKKTIPILEDHIRVAENVAGQIGVPSVTGLNQPEHPYTG